MGPRRISTLAQQRQSQGKGRGKGRRKGRARGSKGIRKGAATAGRPTEEKATERKACLDRQSIGGAVFVLRRPFCELPWLLAGRARVRRTPAPQTGRSARILQLKARACEPQAPSSLCARFCSPGTDWPSTLADCPPNQRRRAARTRTSRSQVYAELRPSDQRSRDRPGCGPTEPARPTLAQVFAPQPAH